MPLNINNIYYHQHKYRPFIFFELFLLSFEFIETNTKVLHHVANANAMKKHMNY